MDCILYQTLKIIFNTSLKKIERLTENGPIKVYIYIYTNVIYIYVYIYIYIYIYICIYIYIYIYMWFTDQKHKPLEGKINLNLLINL